MVLRTREITLPTSKTQALIDFIRAKIASGEWPPGHRLPSRPELMREHGVSLTVVRDAQHTLRTLGELESVPAVGYFVADRPSGTARPNGGL
jgi:DNA-binding FadR family transcriptional regulator